MKSVTLILHSMRMALASDERYDRDVKEVASKLGDSLGRRIVLVGRYRDDQVLDGVERDIVPLLLQEVLHQLQGDGSAGDTHDASPHAHVRVIGHRLRGGISSSHPEVVISS